MTPAPVAPTRWRPTPDQLMILEEVYMGGVKTPNAAQIQRITAHLSLYGKVECKNVFYWFQNHKAREKQKLRKRLLLGKQLQLHDPLHPHQLHDHHHHHYQNIMGQNYHHNNVLYLLQPQYCNYGTFLHAHQHGQGGDLVRCSGPQTIADNTLVRFYCKADNDDAPMTPFTAIDHNQLVAPTTTTRPLQTLQLFPPTSATADAATTNDQNSIPSTAPTTAAA